MLVLWRGDRGYMSHGVKCRFDNISERKANWHFIKSPIINIHDARLTKINSWKLAVFLLQNPQKIHFRWWPVRQSLQRNFWNDQVGLSISEMKWTRLVAEISVILLCNFQFYGTRVRSKIQWKRKNLAGVKCPKCFGASWRRRNGRRHQATTLVEFYRRC